MNNDSTRIVMQEIKSNYDLLRVLAASLIDYTPCDSPIENIFYQQIQKCISNKVKMQKQLECHTSEGTFRLDFIANIDGRVIGFECDGREYHDRKVDRKRDRAILKTGRVRRIYRIRGRDIVCHLHDIIQIIDKLEPLFLCERGRMIVECEATEEDLYRDERYADENDFGFSIARWYYKRDEIYPDVIEDALEPPAVLRWCDK